MKNSLAHPLKQTFKNYLRFSHHDQTKRGFNNGTVEMWLSKYEDSQQNVLLSANIPPGDLLRPFNQIDLRGF